MEFPSHLQLYQVRKAIYGYEYVQKEKDEYDRIQASGCQSVSLSQSQCRSLLMQKFEAKSSGGGLIV